jgi:hypothetical protein
MPIESHPECAPRRRQVSEKTGNSIQSAYLERVFEQELRYTMRLTVRQASTLTDSRTFDDAAATSSKPLNMQALNKQIPNQAR